MHIIKLFSHLTKRDSFGGMADLIAMNDYMFRLKLVLKRRCLGVIVNYFPLMDVIFSLFVWVVFLIVDGCLQVSYSSLLPVRRMFAVLTRLKCYRDQCV